MIRRSDWIIVLCLIVSGTLLWIFQKPILDSSDSIQIAMTNLALTYGYFGAFLISLVGNLTVILPIPYIIALFTLGSIGLNPIFLGIVGGIGATIGEFSAYAIGRGLSMTDLVERYGERMLRVNELIENKGFLAVFFFAVTPLPDDMILIPLGIINYPYRKTLVAMFTGKTILISLTAFAGLAYVAGIEWITLIVGTPGTENIFILILEVWAIILASYLVIRLDWVNIIDSFSKTINRKKKNHS
ncbi:MAG: YqaA family protein [Candidatus Ranarchaeia archaeon]